MKKNTVESPKKGTFRRCYTQVKYPMKKVVFTIVFLLAACSTGLAQEGRITVEQDPAIGKHWQD